MRQDPSNRVHKLARDASVLVDGRLLPERFLIVSNRLPYHLTRQDDGTIDLKPTVGGLVSALDPILRRVGGTWVGWAGDYDELPGKLLVEEESAEYALKPVYLTAQEVEEFYLGYANHSLWPLFHYFQEHCEFDPKHWRTYEEVNQRFADAVLAEYQEGDLIWIHDYHLFLLPALIREKLPGARIGFFLHIPFPSEEIFRIEPHAEQLIEGLLASDLIGFHTRGYAHNFIDVVEAHTAHRVSRDMTIYVGDREVRAGAFPISIDFEHFERIARSDDMPEKVRTLREDYEVDILALGVDRLDYTKGILERLQAIEIMLHRHPELRGKFTFIQISAPSRSKVDTYREMREEIERMVGHINGQFGGKGYIPIDYRYQSYSQEDLVAYYLAADMALVTPLRDGMNLVAKEYVASRTDDDGVLLLSKFTGSFVELRDAVTLNPYDLDSTAEGIYGALHMNRDERCRRMRRMRETVRRNDIYWWLERYLREIP